MWFWIIASLTTLVVAMFFVLALLRARDDDVPTVADYDLQIYRDQLKAAKRDLERGVVSKEDSIRIETEISRRILAADKAHKSEAAATRAQRAPNFATIGVLSFSAMALLGSFWLYQTLGAPGHLDLPLNLRIQQAHDVKENRPSQTVAEARTRPQHRQLEPEHKELLQKLRQAVIENPGDLRGQKLLVGNEASIGDFKTAYRAQIKVLEIKGSAATAQDFADLADLMITAAGGFVSPESEKILQQTLQRDPKNGTALYYTGLMYAQNGRPDIAFRIWRDLLARSAPTDPWVTPVRSQIQEAAAWAGVEYSLPQMTPNAAFSGLAFTGSGSEASSAESYTPNPSADDIAAAAELSDEERDEMVRNMVSQLSDRLTNDGGTAQEWARLIGALGVLGDKERASRIWAEASLVFGAYEAEMEMLLGAARSAGVAE